MSDVIDPAEEKRVVVESEKVTKTPEPVEKTTETETTTEKTTESPVENNS